MSTGRQLQKEPEKPKTEQSPLDIIPVKEKPELPMKKAPSESFVFEDTPEKFRQISREIEKKGYEIRSGSVRRNGEEIGTFTRSSGNITFETSDKGLSTLLDGLM